MSRNISREYVEEFVAEVHHTAQGSSRLEHTVRVKRNCEGSTVHFPWMGAVKAQPHIPRTDVVPANPDWRRPEADILDWIVSDYSDVFEASKTNVEDRQALAKAFRMAIGRQADEVVRAALDDTPTTGTGAVSTVQVGNAADSKFDARETNQGNNRPSGIVAAALAELLDNEAMENGEFFGLLPAIWYPAFAQDPVNINRFYGETDIERMGLKGRRVMSHGVELIFMGDRRETATRAVPGLGEGFSSRSGEGYIWEKNALGLAYGIDPTLEINYVPQKKSHLVSLGFSAGGCLIDPKLVCKITNGPTGATTILTS